MKQAVQEADARAFCMFTETARCSEKGSGESRVTETGYGLCNIYKEYNNIFKILKAIYKYDSMTIIRNRRERCPMKESQARIRSSRYRSQKIIAAAMELFCEKGIEQTSVDEIAAHAGVGSATIYRYYDTRPDLPWKRESLTGERSTVNTWM